MAGWDEFPHHVPSVTYCKEKGAAEVFICPSADEQAAVASLQQSVREHLHLFSFC